MIIIIIITIEHILLHIRMQYLLKFIRIYIYMLTPRHKFNETNTHCSVFTIRAAISSVEVVIVFTATLLKNGENTVAVLHSAYLIYFPTETQ